MRKTYRRSNNKDYWTKRWSDIPADLAMRNNSKYPLKYAELMVKNNRGKILEAGCGAGRILRYYHNLKYEIIGIDNLDNYYSTSYKKKRIQQENIKRVKKLNKLKNRI